MGGELPVCSCSASEKSGRCDSDLDWRNFGLPAFRPQTRELPFAWLLVECSAPLESGVGRCTVVGDRHHEYAYDSIEALVMGVRLTWIRTI
jgi:hypothetical protein